MSAPPVSQVAGIAKRSVCMTSQPTTMLTSWRSRRRTAAKLNAKRVVAAAAALWLGLALGSCSSFSGYVADHWPRWAGGMPPDVPPRPGAPGYNEFVAHGEANQAAATPGTADERTGVQAAPAQSATVQAAPAPVAPAPAVLPAAPAPNDAAAVKGGLY
jgi:hypothetical protein